MPIHFNNSFYVTVYEDRFSLENPTEEENAQQKRYEFYRIIIIPWPRYTQAAKDVLQKKDLTAKSYGELVEGKIYLMGIYFIVLLLDFL